MLNKALPLFQPQWEVEPIMETLQYLIPLEYKKNEKLGRIRINQLYDLNKGALIQNGFSLPLVLEHNGIGNKDKLKYYLKQTGSEVVYAPEEGFQYRLIVTIQDKTYLWYLLDWEGNIVFEYKNSFEQLNNRVYKEIVLSVFNTIYTHSF